MTTNTPTDTDAAQRDIDLQEEAGRRDYDRLLAAACPGVPIEEILRTELLRVLREAAQAPRQRESTYIDAPRVSVARYHLRQALLARALAAASELAASAGLPAPTVAVVDQELATPYGEERTVAVCDIQVTCGAASFCLVRCVIG